MEMFISKIVKIYKTEKTTFKKLQVKICLFTRKTTVKGPKKGSQGGCLDFRQKRGFRRVPKITFLEKHILIKGNAKKALFQL